MGRGAIVRFCANEPGSAPHLSTAVPADELPARSCAYESAVCATADHLLPVVAQRLDAELDNGEREDLLESDGARRQVDLSEPTIADLDVGAYVHVRRGDAACPAGMPVVGNELSTFVLDPIQVAENLHAPPFRVLADLPSPAYVWSEADVVRGRTPAGAGQIRPLPAPGASHSRAFVRPPVPGVS